MRFGSQQGRAQDEPVDVVHRLLPSHDNEVTEIKRRRDFLGLAGSSTLYTPRLTGRPVDFLEAGACFSAEEPAGGCNRSML